MKQFTKRAALVCGLLCTALLCMGIVFIDSVNHYWRNNAGAGGTYVQLLVSNKLVLSINTNTGRIGINVTNANTRGVEIVGAVQPVATNTTGNGAAMANSGAVFITGSRGGDTFATTAANGGTGGNINFSGGAGGDAPTTQTNATGGTGGSVTSLGGAGGMTGITGVATNNAIGGNGGNFTLGGGAGGSPATAATNAVGGSGGNLSLSSGHGGQPSAGWSRKTGSAGTAAITGGNSSDSTRTNSGDGGAVLITAGTSGNVTTAPGDPGNAGSVTILGGAGGTGATNAFGGDIALVGGDGGSTARDGNVLLAASSSAARGSVGVGTNNPQAKLHVAGDIAMTGAALPAYLGASPTNNVQTTNWFGRVQASAAAVIEAAFNQFSELVVTNRIAAATTITLTNSSPGYADMTISLLGEIAGGTSRTVTLVANTGQLIANLDAFGTALATSYAFTLTNGNAVEISDELRQLNGTNVHKIVTRQFAF